MHSFRGRGGAAFCGGCGWTRDSCSRSREDTQGKGILMETYHLTYRAAISVLEHLQYNDYIIHSFWSGNGGVRS